MYQKKNLRTIVYLMRAIEEGGTDTLLDIYVKNFSKEEKFGIFVFTSVPINHERSIYFSLINSGAQVKEPLPLLKSFLEAFTLPLGLLLFLPRQLLAWLKIKPPGLTFTVFRHNVRIRIFDILLAIRLIFFHLLNRPAIYHSISIRLDFTFFLVFARSFSMNIVHSITESPSYRVFYKRKFLNYLLTCRKIISPSLIIEKEIYNLIPELKTAIEIIPWTVFRDSPVKENFYNGRLIIGAIGRFDRLKGYHILLEALAEVNQQFENWNLVLAGDGPERKNLEIMAEKLGISGKIEFTGWVKDVEAIFYRINLFIHPSFTEGMPLAVMEALYFAKPLIVTKVGSVPEMLDSDCGFILEPDNKEVLTEKIKYFLKKPDELKRMSVASKNFFENNFSHKRILNKLSDLYAEIMKMCDFI
jgi:glycosyltransferase involved in cell wall biosynthesis